MEKVNASKGIRGWLIRGFGLLWIVTMSVVTAQGQMAMEGRMAALEARIQQLEAELSEVKGTPPLEPRLAEVEKSVAEIEESADFEGLSFFNGVRFSGLLDAYYGFDFNEPSSPHPRYPRFRRNPQQRDSELGRVGHCQGCQ